MPQYMLVLRDNESGGAAPTEEQLRSIFKRFGSWKDELVEKGHLRGGSKLKDGEGRVLRQKGGKVVTADGPYRAEEEVLGGYFLIEAKSWDEAATLAKSCPQLDFGPIEVREIEEM
jgi:hypothetical protein